MLRLYPKFQLRFKNIFEDESPMSMSNRTTAINNRAWIAGKSMNAARYQRKRLFANVSLSEMNNCNKWSVGGERKNKRVGQ